VGARVQIDPIVANYAHQRGFDATAITPRLYQGGAPPPGDYLARHGFHLLVLCARGFQPYAKDYPGVRIRRYGMLDDKLTPRSWKNASSAIDDVISALRRGETVLVTCELGLNRSGLIVGGALCRAEGMRGDDAIRRIRSRRGGDALNNESYADALRATWP
jgi:hypothetical protein